MATTTACTIGSTPCFSLDPTGRSPLMGFNFPFSSIFEQGASSTAGFSTRELQEMGPFNHYHTSLASIESLISINQDLHWKLQQRLAILFGGKNQKETNVSSIPFWNQIQKPQPILLHNLDNPKANTCGIADDNSSRKESAENNGGNTNLSTEWFFDNAYGPVTPTLTNSSHDRCDQPPDMHHR